MVGVFDTPGGGCFWLVGGGVVGVVGCGVGWFWGVFDTPVVVCVCVAWRGPVRVGCEDREEGWPDRKPVRWFLQWLLRQFRWFQQWLL